MESKKFRLGLLILLIGACYYLLIRYTGFGIPCLFYSVTNLKCPGCGITRMILECTQLHWKIAARENYFLFYTSPLLAGFCIYEFFIEKKNKAHAKIVNYLVIGYLILLLIWMIVRNVLGM